MEAEYFQAQLKHKASYTILTLKHSVLAPNPDLAALVCIFQELLESVGTPETVERTLNHLKEFKAQALMYYIRDFQNHLLSASDTIQHLQRTLNEILIRYIPEEGAPTTQLLQENDAYLSTRFKAFVDTLSNPNTDNIALIISLNEEFSLPTFQFSFCKFLDQIHNSLQHSVAMDAQRDLQQNEIASVKLKATDMVTVIDKLELQAIHKVNDPELSAFLEKSGMKEFFNGNEDNKQISVQDTEGEFGDVSVLLPTTESSMIDIHLGDGFDYDAMHEIDTNGLPSNLLTKEFNLKSCVNLPIVLKKRKRPHEDTVDAAGKRRATPNPNAVDWGDENAYPVPIALGDHLRMKVPFVPMREIAFPIRKPRTIPVATESIKVSSPCRRASGKTVTGQRKRKRWTEQEVDFLLEGVRLFGIGCWKDILNHFSFGDRTYVDLKDKFRNLRKHYSTEELLGLTGSSLLRK